MTKSDKTSKQPSEVAHPKDLWSLPKEEAIAQLMQLYDMNRERAEAILRRDPNEVRRHAVNRLSEEEFNRIEEELANSPSVLMLGRKDLKKQSHDDTEHDD